MFDYESAPESIIKNRNLQYNFYFFMVWYENLNLLIFIILSYFKMPSRYINNTEISAGVTPDILDACPTLYG